VHTHIRIQATDYLASLLCSEAEKEGHRLTNATPPPEMQSTNLGKYGGRGDEEREDEKRDGT